MARIIQDYTAVKEDEITVLKGENVQIIGASQQGLILVHRAANDLSPAAEGWLPIGVLDMGENKGAQR